MKSCLVIDDSAALRTVARRILEELQFVVSEAEDGTAGLRACRENMPDLVFLDWNMPHMKGLEFVRNLRGQQYGDHPRILFCTTEHDKSEIASAIAAGANEFVMKPYDRTQIRAKLATLAA